MTLSIGLLAFVMICAFLMGYAINQGSTCAVTAAKQLIHQRHGTMFTGFVVAMGTAGLLCLPLSWLFGSAVHLQGNVPLSPTLALGAILLAVGAVVNDACLLGTLSRVGHGEIRFLALPLGLAIGFALADRQTALVAGAATDNPYAVLSLSGVLIVAAFAALLLASWVVMGRIDPRPSQTGWTLRRAMVVLGTCGALLFAVTPGWTYADAVHRAFAAGGMNAMVGFGVLWAAASVLAGAVVSGIRARAFVLQRPTVAATSRSLIGGAIMAFGGSLIPGGNDTLLLASVPAATTSGLAAYTIMSITVPALLLVQRRFR